MAEAIVVGIIVGLFSGLLGTIAGPYVGLKMDRRRRSEVREEERQRAVRDMLEAMMRLGRAQQSGIVEYQLAPATGRTIEQVRLRQVEYLTKLEQIYPFFLWRPHRIKDAKLLGLARDLQDANTSSTLLIYDRINGLAGPDWDGDADQAKQRIDHLLEDVDVRLDELGW